MTQMGEKLYRMDDEDRVLVVRCYEESRARGYDHKVSMEWAARETGWSLSAVKKLMLMLTDRRQLAQKLLHAQADKMVDRLVEKAGPELLLDILSRPGIDVIQPKVEANQSQGFMLAVGIESCGAVSIGVKSGQIQQTGSLREGSAVQSSSEGLEGLQVLDVQPEVEGGAHESHGPDQGEGNAQGLVLAHPRTVERASEARERLRKARETAKPKRIRKNRPASDYKPHLSYKHESFDET